MKKKKVILICLFGVILGGVLGGLYFFSSKKVIEEKKEELLIPETALQCLGVPTSYEVVLKGKYQVLNIKEFEEIELKELAFYQLLYAFSNFQYNPLSTPLQYVQMRTKPQITLEKVDHHPYARELEGVVELPDFLQIEKINWPQKINKDSEAITVEYSAKVKLDFCLKDSETKPSSIDFYAPLDPLYAYYTLDRKHWNYRELEPWGKTITINLCQNLHHYFSTDEEYSKSYWYLWNPTKRGKELHTLHYDCRDWLKENEDYIRLSLEQRPVETEKFLPKKESEVKNVHVRIIMHDKNQDFSFYETSVMQILKDKIFLSNIPDIAKEEHYIFRLLEKISEELKNIKFHDVSQKEESYIFIFDGEFEKRNLHFTLELGESFTAFDDKCDIGLTYSPVPETDKRYLSFEECENEAFFIPLASQFAHLLEIKPSQKSWRYYLLGLPDLSIASSGVYLFNFFLGKNPPPLRIYLEQNGQEDGYFVQASSTP